MQLIKTFTQEQYAAALESWSWLDLAGKQPEFASLFGDVFLSSAEGWWMLDTLDGALERRWDSGDELRAVLATEDGQDQYLLGGLAIAADERGLVLGADEIYDFLPPPILGGGFAVENITVMDFVVSVNIAGQLHHQLRDLPPGTQISGFQLSE
jgi:hypothetical protein